jgi:tRNA threonylcarbamoyl adenosine modification protein YjeE
MAQAITDSRMNTLADEAATGHLAARLARLARAGDVIALAGDLGLGKTSFARAFIRALAGDPALEVPSPTFTLVQTYELGDVAVWHFDLYRLARDADVWELGFEEAMAGAISLIEWPERIATLLPAHRLDVVLTQGDSETSRRARLLAHDGWVERLARADLDG